MTSAERTAALIDSYVKYLGPEVVHPVHYHDQYGMLERYTKGCLSPFDPGLLSRHGAALRPALGRLEWAGAESARIWNGYMDGTVRTGHAAALRAPRSR